MHEQAHAAPSGRTSPPVPSPPPAPPGPHPAPAAPGPLPATQAADWLAGRLTSGIAHNAPNGFDDYGLTTDADLALDAVGGHAPTSGRPTTRWTGARQLHPALPRRPHVRRAGWPSSASRRRAPARHELRWGPPGQDLEGRVARPPRSPAASRTRVHAWRPVDDTRQRSASPTPPSRGPRPGAPTPPAVAAFLLEQQCPGGYSASNSRRQDRRRPVELERQTRPRHRRDHDRHAALASQSPADAGVAPRSPRRRPTWYHAARRYGSFGGGTAPGFQLQQHRVWSPGPWVTPRPRDRRPVAARAPGDQADDRRRPATETGAIAYDDAGLAEGRADGITDAASDQWRRATAQAAPGIACSPATRRRRST